jgi:hypothetical protein
METFLVLKTSLDLKTILGKNKGFLSRKTRQLIRMKVGQRLPHQR